MDHDTDLILPGTGLGGYIDNIKPARHLHSWCKMLEINDIAFHNLRATYTTRLFEAGIQLKDRSEAPWSFNYGYG